MKILGIIQDNCISLIHNINIMIFFVLFCNELIGEK
jgi:hypothetical protein